MSDAMIANQTAADQETVPLSRWQRFRQSMFWYSFTRDRVAMVVCGNFCPAGGGGVAGARVGAD